MLERNFLFYFILFLYYATFVPSQTIQYSLTFDDLLIPLSPLTGRGSVLKMNLSFNDIEIRIDARSKRDIDTFEKQLLFFMDYTTIVTTQTMNFHLVGN